MNFILKVLITSVGTGILSLAVSIFYTYNLSTKLVGIVKVEGNEIANKVENTILEDVREGDEKVILTLVDSETVRNRVYQDALGQAKAKTYIDFVDGRYQFQKKWNILRYKLTEDKNSVDERFIITLIDDTNDIDKNVSLFFSEVLLRFPGDMGKLLEKSGRERSILLTEDEQDAIEVCFNKHKDEADLFSLINLVLSDPNVIKELEKKEAYDLEYYEVQDYTKGDQIKKDEKIASISDSNVVIVIKKTNRNLTPYDKIGIIGSFLDSLRFQNASQ